MFKKTLTLTILSLLLFSNIAIAGDCFSDPIYERNWNGEIIISAFVRDVACMEGSVVLTTVPKGSVVKIIADTDGWYKVQLSDGTIGWIGQRLMQVTSKPLSGTTGSNNTSAPAASASSLAKYIGYIFLAVEKNGEAYYFDPKTQLAYFLGRPTDAFDIMRELGLGATHDFISNTAYFPDHVVGKILLDVETNGEAYYIYPKDRKKYYLGRPADAFDVMRNLGLGISNKDLENLPKAK